MDRTVSGLAGMVSTCLWAWLFFDGDIFGQVLAM
jgi:hypothetical protein